jgi:tRNA(Ile)-lysidine synthase
VLAAVSGGPDSMAMFHALCMLARERNGLRVIAAHFDHRLRRDSDLDRELVRRAADQYGARFATGHGDVIAHMVETRQSLEAAARELRYAFLERIADEAKAGVIATAHTRDDQIETVLMRILHGAHARGLRGILATRGRIVRPLLAVSRADTHGYCRTHAIPFVEDASNNDRRHERNAIRHDVLPALRWVYPGLDAALVHIAANAHAEFARAEEVTARRLQLFLQPEVDRSWLLAMDAFTGLDDADDRCHLLAATLDAMSARDDVTGAHYRQMLVLLDAGVGAITDIPGVRVRREHDGLVFTRKGNRFRSAAPIHSLPVPGALNLGGWHLEAERVGAPDPGELARSGKRTAYLCCNDSLVVRFPRDGDRMQPFGMSGHKKLSDLFIDRKVPHRLRDRIPVVESEGEIVWVVGVATSESARVIARSGDVVRLTAVRSAP